MNIKARAKINISLDVLRKRNDGYHDVCMIMQTLDLCDDVSVMPNDYGISVSSNLDYLPNDENNIAYKAAQLFFLETNIENIGVNINIFKRIPVSAGLAGGSSNAAAVLHAMNNIFDTKLSIDELMDIGKKLGADVPFCLCGGTMLAEGIGTKLTRLKPMEECDVVLCKPAFSVSTKEIYSKIDIEKIDIHPDTGGILFALESNNYNDITEKMYNVMENITSEMHKELLEIKKILIQNDADVAIMSGSGPTMFGLFKDKNSNNAYEKLVEKYDDTIVCKISNEFYV